MSTGVATPAGAIGPAGATGATGPAGTSRQCVMSGPVDSYGRQTFLPASTAGLAISTQNVSGSTPLIVSAAGGFGASGAVDRIGSTSGNLTWGGLTGMVQPSTTKFSRSGATITAYCVAHGLSVGDTIMVYAVNPSGYNGKYQVASVPNSDTFTYVVVNDPGAYSSGGTILLCNFLFIDVASDGALTARSTTKAPVHQQGGLYSVVNNVFTFNCAEMVGKLGNGSTAAQTYSVLVGRAWTNATAVQKAISRPYGTPADGAIWSSRDGVVIEPFILADFTAHNIGASLATQDQKNTYIYTPPAAGDSLNKWVKNLPAPPFRVVLGARLDITPNNYNQAGLVLRDSSNSKCITFSHQYNNGFIIMVSKFTNDTTWSGSNYATGSARDPGWGDIFLSIACDGFKFYFDLSLDGRNWFTFTSVAMTDFTPSVDKIGVYTDPNNVSQPVKMSIFHWGEDVS